MAFFLIYYNVSKTAVDSMLEGSNNTYNGTVASKADVMTKPLALIRERALDKFNTNWKPLLDFLHETGKKNEITASNIYKLLKINCRARVGLKFCLHLVVKEGELDFFVCIFVFSAICYFSLFCLLLSLDYYFFLVSYFPKKLRKFYNLISSPCIIITAKFC